jgi:hypothetical protein
LAYSFGNIAAAFSAQVVAIIQNDAGTASRTRRRLGYCFKLLPLIIAKKNFAENPNLAA